jgi:hypothetical protein
MDDGVGRGDPYGAAHRRVIQRVGVYDVDAQLLQGGPGAGRPREPDDVVSS